MKLPLTGGCQCGALRYEVSAEPLTVYVCHCTECQRQSGGAFGMSAVVPRQAVAFTAGTPRRWERKADSGNRIAGDFCPTCGVRTVHHPSSNEKVSILKPGTLDDTHWLWPVAHIWTASAQRWVQIPPDTIRHAGHPGDLTPMIEAWRRRRERM